MAAPKTSTSTKDQVLPTQKFQVLTLDQCRLLRISLAYLGLFLGLRDPRFFDFSFFPEAKTDAEVLMLPKHPESERLS